MGIKIENGQYGLRISENDVEVGLANVYKKFAKDKNFADGVFEEAVNGLNKPNLVINGEEEKRLTELAKSAFDALPKETQKEKLTKIGGLDNLHEYCSAKIEGQQPSKDLTTKIADGLRNMFGGKKNAPTAPTVKKGTSPGMGL